MNRIALHLSDVYRNRRNHPGPVIWRGMSCHSSLPVGFASSSRKKNRPRRAGGRNTSKVCCRLESDQTPAPTILAISRQDFAHSRHNLAQAAIFSSPACFSHSAAHKSQHSAQHTHAGPASGLWRAESVEASLQHSAQSAQSWADLACSFLPPSSMVRQCLKQESHCNWQSAQTFAHFMKCSECWLSPGAACRARATSPEAINEKLDNILRPPKGMSVADCRTRTADLAVVGKRCTEETQLRRIVNQSSSRELSCMTAPTMSKLLSDPLSRCAANDHDNAREFNCVV